MYSAMGMGRAFGSGVGMARARVRDQRADREANAAARARLIERIGDSLPPSTPYHVIRDQIFSVLSSRGVPSLDIFTELFVGRFRRGMGHAGLAEDLTRRLLVVHEVETRSVKVTVWTPEPVLSTMIIVSDTSDLSLCGAHLHKVEPILRDIDGPMGTRIDASSMRGRWSGWLAYQQGLADPTWDCRCVSVNLSCSAIYFGVHIEGRPVEQCVMTVSSMEMIQATFSDGQVTPEVAVMWGSGMVTQLVLCMSTNGDRSTMKIFSDGMTQLCGRPDSITRLCGALRTAVLRTFTANPAAFLRTTRVVERGIGISPSWRPPNPQQCP